MSVDVTTLGNGLRVVTHTMPHVETTSLGVWVGVGARHETVSQHGISHLLEHMAFKGTRKRSAQAIAEEIEAVGGDLNAATSLETTAYYARVLKGDEGVALELLADILLNSTYGEEELVREREVILQEIAGIRDSPEELAYDLLYDAAYPGQPVGRPIIGTPETVVAQTSADLRAFLVARYRPGSMVVSAAGAVHHEAFVRHVEALFGGLTGVPAGAEQPARYHGGQRAHAKAFEQSHYVVGFEGPSYRDEAFYTAQVFSGLFGGGMSSRLFQEVRERRGLCYSIYSTAWGVKDGGMFGIHAATGKNMMRGLIDVVHGELDRVAREGVAAAEVARSKAQLKAGLLMALESSSARAEQMARHLIAHGRVIDSAELIQRVDEVSADSIAAFARGLRLSPPSVVVVGAGRSSAPLARYAAELATASQ